VVRIVKSARWRVGLPALVLVAVAGCSETVAVTPPSGAAAILITAPQTVLTAGTTMQLTYSVVDAAGNPLPRSAEWSSSDEGVATVGSAALVTAIAPGTATLTARVDRVAASLSLRVDPVPVASVTLSPAALSLPHSSSSSISAVARDASGATLTGVAFRWSSADTSVATVSAGGVVTGVGVGSTTVTATVASVHGSATVAVTSATTPAFPPRAHMDPQTLALYDRIRGLDGWIIGIGSLGGAGGRDNVAFEHPEAMARWRQLFGANTPVAYEFEMGEAGAPTLVRDWPSVRAFAEPGGLPWIRLTARNFVHPRGPNFQGTAWDTRGGIAPVLPGGAAHGAFTSYLRQLAQQVKAIGRPVFFRPFHEMNGGWFWWGRQPADYRQLWRLTFEIFAEEGVENVVWVWAVSGDCPASSPCTPLSYYPGDDVVDVVGGDHYFDSAELPEDHLRVISLLETLPADKPIFLNEFGPAAREDFWSGAPTALRRIPRLRGMIFWFARGWRVWGPDPTRGSLIDESSPPPVRQAFDAFLADPATRTLERFLSP
jgi:hypothetical protein